MKRVLAATILALISTPLFAAVCIDTSLTWPKVIIYKHESRSYLHAVALLEEAAKSSETGEAEFYRAVIEYRLGHQQAFLDSMDSAQTKHHYLASAFYGLAFEQGLFGFDADPERSSGYFDDFQRQASVCREMSAESSTPAAITPFLLLLFDIDPDSLQYGE